MHGFKLFLKFDQVEFHTTINALKSYYVGEFMSFTKFLTELGISHILTYPHTSHQNGSFERKHRHIVAMGLKLLAHAFIPLHFWDHSFATTVHVIDRIPSARLPIFHSSYHALYHKLPSYEYLVVLVFHLLDPITNINWTS